MDYSYRFPVVRGKQAGNEYYIAMVPLKMISKLFPSDDEYVPPEFRAQRRLNESRIPVISKYITDNKDSYVFSALAASIDGEIQFNEISNGLGIGILEVSMDSKFLINDGQHRKAAILDALNEEPDLGNETISVVFFGDKGLSRSQQIFTDLNKHAVKTSNSISELYDNRDELAVVNRRVISSVAFLNSYTDKETDNLGKYSCNLFTLNTFYKANKRIIGNTNIDSETEQFLTYFWDIVSKNIVPWVELETKQILKKDLRENYIVTQGIVIQAIGVIGNYLFNNENMNVDQTLKKLRDINWHRNAECWRERVVRSDGKVLTSNNNIILTSIQIKKQLNIPLSHSERSKEKQLANNKG